VGLSSLLSHTNETPKPRDLLAFEKVVGVPEKSALQVGAMCWWGNKKAEVLSRACNQDGLVTHYFVRVPPCDGVSMVQTFVEAQEAHNILLQRQRQKDESKKKNQQRALETEAAEYQQLQGRYNRGELRFIPANSPPNSPRRIEVMQNMNEDFSGLAPGYGVIPPTDNPMVGTFSEQVLLRPSSESNENICQHNDTVCNDGFPYVPSDHDSSGSGISDDEEENVTRNESGQEAIELAPKVSFELSTITSPEIWNLLINKKFRGGILARTLFIAAKGLDTAICEPWIGEKKLASKKKDLEDQRSSFLQWANTSKRVLEWIRLELFKIVLSKQLTYKSFSVTHANVSKKDLQSASGMTAESVQVTDNVMARIAHIVCDSECRVILNMLFDSKIREAFDARDIQPAKLWQDLASMYVNNDNWEISQVEVPQLEVVVQSSKEITSKIDVSKAPLLGLTGDCVRDTFTQIKSMFTNLSNAVLKPNTGCNETGEALFSAVWSRYINGKYLFFARPNVAMYVFKLWSETKGLPQYVSKELTPEAQIRLGVISDAVHFNLPTTPRTDSHKIHASTPSSQTSTTASMQSMQESITSYFSMKVKQESQSAETFQIEPPKPDAELHALLQRYDLLSVWDSINPFLFVRTVKDFSFLSQARLDVHVPPSKFPAIIRIKLEQCMDEAKHMIINLTK
jgi:hypothetical protein